MDVPPSTALMKKMNYKGRDFLKNIFLWSLFSLAIMRSLALFELNRYVLYLLLPGTLFFCFLIYYRLKTRRLLTFKKFFISVFIISSTSHLFNLLLNNFLRLNTREDQLLFTLLLIGASLVVSSLLYPLSFSIKNARA